MSTTDIAEDTRVAELEECIRHSEALATAEDEAAEWEIKMGRPVVVTYRARAQTHRRSAEAFRMEIATGVPHCVCCLKPFAKGIRIPGVAH